MATISVTNTLDVVDKYQALVKESLSGESTYIRAKETLQELFDNGTITESQKAEVLSNVVGSIVNNITSSSMATAMSWAQAEKEIALKKLEMAEQLDILDEEYNLKQAQTEQIINATRLAKVESKRLYGTAAFDANNNLVSLDNSGKVYTDMLLTTAQTSKTAEEENLVEQKIVESYAAVHKIVADTYVNYGNYNYTGVDKFGIDTVTELHGSYKTLSDTQREIAVEQAKGYTYNAWANALTGSASMLGTAIAAEYAEFGSGQPGGILLDTILDTARNLKAASTTVDEASPTY
jgi:hypothetical protein